MKHTFEYLFESTGDLLYRVRMYDRDSIHREEIMQLDETHSMIGNTKWMAESDLLREHAAWKLVRMKQRLLTLLENLLYTA